MLIGVVSDTHGFFDPRLTSALQGVDEILHAGDVGSEAVLDQLRAIAPVHAVRGNVDSAALGLPPTLHGDLARPGSSCSTSFPGRNRRSATGRRELTWKEIGGAMPRVPGKLSRSLPSGNLRPQPRALRPDSGGKLFFNPGSAGKRRFSLPRCCGLLEISAESVHATFHGLESYNEVLPVGVSLPIGGGNKCGIF